MSKILLFKWSVYCPCITGSRHSSSIQRVFLLSLHLLIDICLWNLFAAMWYLYYQSSKSDVCIFIVVFFSWSPLWSIKLLTSSVFFFAKEINKIWLLLLLLMLVLVVWPFLYLVDLLQWLVRELTYLQNLIDRANEKGWRREYPFIISTRHMQYLNMLHNLICMRILPSQFLANNEAKMIHTL
jgi:hypothetical protein